MSNSVRSVNRVIRISIVAFVICFMIWLAFSMLWKIVESQHGYFEAPGSVRGHVTFKRTGNGLNNVYGVRETENIRYLNYLNKDKYNHDSIIHEIQSSLIQDLIVLPLGMKITIQSTDSVNSIMMVSVYDSFLGKDINNIRIPDNLVEIE